MTEIVQCMGTALRTETVRDKDDISNIVGMEIKKDIEETNDTVPPTNKCVEELRDMLRASLATKVRSSK